MTDELTSFELDVFSEMGSIGSGNAATALSQMINKKVIIEPIKTTLVPIEQVPYEIGGPEIMVMAVYLRVMGDLGGDAVYLHPKKQALELISFVSGNKNIKIEPTEEDISVYKELSNIFTGSYLNAISTMLDVMMIPSIPHYASDMLGALIDFILAEIGKDIDNILMIKTNMMIDNQKIDGGYLMLFNPDSQKKMMELIKQKYT
jgi:chemotaxis protein CheC